MLHPHKLVALTFARWKMQAVTESKVVVLELSLISISSWALLGSALLDSSYSLQYMSPWALYGCGKYLICNDVVLDISV